MTDDFTPTVGYDENMRTAIIYAYGEQVERTYREANQRLGIEEPDEKVKAVRARAVGHVVQWLDREQEKGLQQRWSQAVDKFSELEEKMARDGHEDHRSEDE